MTGFPPAADLPTMASGGGREWREAWWFDAVADDVSLAVAVAIGRHGEGGRGWYWAVVAGADRPPVVVADPDLGLSGSGPPLEVRAPGLWADHNPSAPGGHWSVAAEAFGVALDDPWAAWGRAYGHPTPVGLDLEWDPVTAPLVVDGDLDGGAGSWAVGCDVHGEILVGAERFEVSWRGSRGRWWGGEARPEAGSLEVTGWTPQGWFHEVVAAADPPGFPGEVAGPGSAGVGAGLIAGLQQVAWAPVLDGAGTVTGSVAGTSSGGSRLGMAVVAGGTGRAGLTGWLRWRPGTGSGVDLRGSG